MDAFSSTIGLLKRVCLPLVAVLAHPGMSFACSPPAPTVDAGFYRDDVSHLPRNARGVMFFLPSQLPKAKVSDFRLASDDDKRPLALRLHSLPPGGAIRLEPIGGFLANARYTFQYLPTHENWRFADRISVKIDDAVVDTAGTYAIELTPQPEVRMIVVPGSPACTEPAVALTQPFSYRVPAALAAYRAELEYSTEVRPEPLRGKNKGMPALYGWPYRLTSYYNDIFWPYRRRIDDHYTGGDDAIIASCDQTRLRGQLRGSVAFPEVDDKAYRVAPVSVDLGRNALGQCRPLDALRRTMQVYGAKQALQAVCGRTYAFGYEAGKTGVADAVDGWERALGLLNELSPTCTLVTLAHAMRTREFLPDPKAMGRLGAALDDGLRFADAMWRTDSNPLPQDPAYLQAIDGLDYLMHELPADLRPQASAMLLPLLPRLADHLAEAQPYRPDAVAALIVRGGSLPDKVRVQLTAIAKGRTAGAPQARAVLASLSGKAG